MLAHVGMCVCVCAGLDAARRLGLPISEHETLFSTPPDLDELEDLLNAHPYPQVGVSFTAHTARLCLAIMGML